MASMTEPDASEAADTPLLIMVPLVGRATAASLVFTQAPTTRAPFPMPAASLVAPAVWTLRFGASTEPVVVDSVLFVGRNPVATPARAEAGGSLD